MHSCCFTTKRLYMLEMGLQLYSPLRARMGQLAWHSLKYIWDCRNDSLSFSALLSNDVFPAQLNFPLASEEDSSTIYIKSFPIINRNYSLLY